MLPVPVHYSGSALGKLWSRLSARERWICDLICDGLKNKQIAELVGTSEQSVKNMLRIIFDKIGADSRLQLALLLTRDTLEAKVAGNGSKNNA